MKQSVDTTNLDPKYWEEVLEQHGLGTRQLGLHEDSQKDYEAAENPVPDTSSRRVGASRREQDLEALRRKIDGSDPFMTHGHQIKKIPVYLNQRKEFDWAGSNADIQKIISIAFPNWRTNPLQRKRAARWIQVIYLFYRVKLSQTQVAQEMRVSKEVIKNTLNSIKRVARGKTAKNKVRIK